MAVNYFYCMCNINIQYTWLLFCKVCSMFICNVILFNKLILLKSLIKHYFIVNSTIGYFMQLNLVPSCHFGLLYFESSEKLM